MSQNRQPSEKAGDVIIAHSLVQGGNEDPHRYSGAQYGG